MLQTVFIDSTNKQLFTSSNDVNNVTRTKLLFTPSDVLLHPEDALTFLVYDKVDPKKKVFIIICQYFNFYKIIIIYEIMINFVMVIYNLSTRL